MFQHWKKKDGKLQRCVDVYALEGEEILCLLGCVLCVAAGLESYLCLDAAAGWNRVEGSGCSGERLGCLGEWKDRDPETGG